MPKNRLIPLRYARLWLAMAFTPLVAFISIARADWLPDEILHHPQEAHFLELRGRSLVAHLKQGGLDTIAAWPHLPPIQLSALEKELSTIRYVQLATFAKPAGATRWTAFHEFGGRRIYVNAGAQLDPLVADTLALHELLGALGYAEPDYQVSLLASFYANVSRNLHMGDVEQQTTLDHLRRLLGAPLPIREDPNPHNRILLGRSGQGGGDIIGGGGDGDALCFKTQLLHAPNAHATMPAMARFVAQVAGLSVDVVDKTSDPRGITIAEPATLLIERSLFRVERFGNVELEPSSLSYARKLLEARGMVDAD